MPRFYNRKVPTSFTEALRMCKDYAKTNKNLSVERIADEMGLTAVRLYQHLESGDMPFNRVRSFQRACGCNYVTQYMAHGDDCVLIKIPNGKKMSDEQMLNINSSFHKALSHLTSFYQNAANPELVVAALTDHMATTAWHRANVEKHLQPELDFDGE
jgi:hypothetical protein